MRPVRSLRDRVQARRHLCELIEEEQGDVMAFFMTSNGKRVEANDGEMVLAVARRAGIDLSVA